jgi:hypothetical protein
MSPLMLAELSHLFFLEACDWKKPDAEKRRLMRIARKLAQESEERARRTA